MMYEPPLMIAACRPVVWTEQYAALGPETPVYPGSVVKQCAGCHVDVWLGPRGQDSGAIPMCFRCAVEANEEQLTLISLGNPYMPKGSPYA